MIKYSLLFCIILVLVYPFAPFGYVVIFGQGGLFVMICALIYLLYSRRIVITKEYFFILIIFFLAYSSSYLEVLRFGLTMILVATLTRYDTEKLLRIFLAFNALAVFFGLLILPFINDYIFNLWDVDQLNISNLNPIWQRIYF